MPALPNMQVDISSVGSTKVGQDLCITCTVRLVERLVVKPTIMIMIMNSSDIYLLQDTNIPYNITTNDNGSETNLTLKLKVKFEYRGVYVCNADFNVTGVHGTNDPATATHDAQFVEEEFQLIVQCEYYNFICILYIAIIFQFLL